METTKKHNELNTDYHLIARLKYIVPGKTVIVDSKEYTVIKCIDHDLEYPIPSVLTLLSKGLTPEEFINKLQPTITKIYFLVIKSLI